MKTWLILIRSMKAYHIPGNYIDLYNRFLYKKLDEMPPGTRLATFHCLEDKIPIKFSSSRKYAGCLLKFWLKT